MRLSALLAGALLLTGITASAQSKFAYISFNELVRSMPETQKADTVLVQFQTALQQEYETMQTKYATDASLLTSRDTGKYTPSQLFLKRKSLTELLAKIQGYDQEAGRLLEQKRSDLFLPIQQKAEDAIRQVSKENGYAYVFEKDNLHFYPPGDDILPLVKRKLATAIR
jgi:outer membrane protein